GGQLRQLGELARAGLSVDAGGLGHGDHPDVRRRHELRHRPLLAQRRLRERARNGGRVQRRCVRQREWPVPRLPHHADGDRGAGVLHRRRRVRRGTGDVQPDGHAAGSLDHDHHAAPDHDDIVHHHDHHAAPDHDVVLHHHDHHAAPDHDVVLHHHDHHAAPDHDDGLHHHYHHAAPDHDVVLHHHDHHAAPDHDVVLHHHDHHAAPDHDVVLHHHDHHTAPDHDVVLHHHATADNDHQHDHHDAAVVDHPHGVPNPDAEHRLVEHQWQRVGPVHQPQAAPDRLARCAVLQPAQHAPEPAQLPLARGRDELQHLQRQPPVAKPPEHHEPPRQHARGGRGLVEDLPGGRRLGGIRRHLLPERQ